MDLEFITRINNHVGDLQKILILVDDNEELKAKVGDYAKQLEAKDKELAAAKSALVSLNEKVAVLEKQLAEKPVAPKPEVVVKKSYEPFTITKGGTYSDMHIRSTDTKIPCVEINTTEEVIIQNSLFEYAGIALKNHHNRTNVRVLNNKGKGLPHTGDAQSDPRRFMSLNNVINLLVRNNDVEGTGFLTTQGEFVGSSSQGIIVQLNNVRNINGLTATGRKHTNFVQIMNSRGKGVNAEISYNRIVNTYGESDVEDNINIYNARGFADRPIWIHHNRIQGAYYHPTQEKNKYYSGGGIIMDGDGDYANAPAYVVTEDNLLTDLGNYHLGMAAGHHNVMRRNIVINDGFLPDGRRFWDIQSTPKMQTSGIWAKPQRSTQGVMDHNLFEKNIVGVNYYERQNNVSVMIGAVERDNTFLTKVDKALKEKYIQEWEEQHKNLIIGNHA